MITFAYLAILPAVLLWSGFVFATLWGWVAAPVLGLPMITIGQAVLMMLLFRFALNHRRHSKSCDSWAEFGDRLTDAVLFPAVILGVAWCFKAWVL